MHNDFGGFDVAASGGYGTILNFNVFAIVWQSTNVKKEFSSDGNAMIPNTENKLGENGGLNGGDGLEGGGGLEGGENGKGGESGGIYGGDGGIDGKGGPNGE